MRHWSRVAGRVHGRFAIRLAGRVGARSWVSRVVRIERPGQQEALGFVDVFAAEVVHLVGGLDAFGEGGEAEVLAELDEGADQRLGLG